LPGGAGETLGDALLAPHRWYGRALLPLAAAGQLRALAHVTGGGIAGNLVRVLPARCCARVSAAAWPRPALFRWLQQAGGVPEDDARRALNLGVGMIAVVEAARVSAVNAALASAGETSWRLGEVIEGERGVEWMSG
jgi:phosphoribosylformylglycinamidine cyclo-ligase